MKAYLNQQQEIRHQEEVIAKLRSFNREKSIRRAESREKMLDKIEVLEKPTDADDEMKIRLEPDIVSGNDVLTIRDLGKSFGPLHLFSPCGHRYPPGRGGWLSSAATEPARPPC